MDKKYAVIDLGSNTFHLLVTDHLLNTVAREREYVFLAESGIDHITDEATVRGEKALNKFVEILKSYNVESLKIVGTSALRSARNATEVITKFNDILKNNIEIIDGKREADLIYKGILLLMSGLKDKGTHLFMDIGGGSTEFSLLHNGVRLFSESYDLGGGVLYNKFHNSEPISQNDIQAMEEYIQKTTYKLTELLDKHPLDSIVGSSGTYETFQYLSDEKLLDTEPLEVDRNKIINFMKDTVLLDYEERKVIEGISSSRAKLLVVGYLLVLFFTDRYHPKHIYTSPYGIKEGLLSELLQIRAFI